MKIKNFTIAVVLTFLLTLNANLNSQTDPFNWTEPVTVESNDILISWSENVAGTYFNYQKIYRYKTDSTFLPADSAVKKTPRQVDNRISSATSLYCDEATGKFNKDQYDDIVSIWYGQAGIEIKLPKFDTTDANWTTSIEDNINAPENMDRIYVRTGNFDNDSLDEFIVAYIDIFDSVHFNLYDVDSTLQPSLITSFTDTKLTGAFGFQFIRYFIESADLNGDGNDELILAAAETPPGPGTVPVKIKIYEINNSSVIQKSNLTIDVPRQTTLEDFTMSLTSGQFKNDVNPDKEEIAFVTMRSSNGLHYSYSYIMESAQDLQSITVGNRYRVTPDGSNTFKDLSAAAGDLNNDGRDELVFTSDTKYYILEPDDNLDLVLTNSSGVASGGTNDYKQSYNFLKIADVNQDNREDIIIVKNFVQNQFADGFFVAMIGVNDALTSTFLIGRLFGDEPQSDVYQQFSIAVGNFDGFDFKIGQPTHFTQTGIVQPIVILNAPPVHFDKLNGQLYDVNSCYNGGDCDFYAKYIKENSNTVEISTKIHKDWAISAGLSYSGSVTASPLGVGVDINYEAYFLKNYGRQFDLDSTNIQTVTVGVEVYAREDDQIYSTITDYDLWEYPVYHGNESIPRNTILTVVPNNVRGQWFPSKSYNAVSYIPDHEVGNILSYFPYDTLSNNPNAAQTIRADYLFGSFTLSANTSYNWNLIFDDFGSNQADTVIENGTSAKYSFGYHLEGNYNNKNVSTHKTSISELINLNSHLGSVNMGIGDVKYTVTPYSYWAQNDALVIDYAVKPEIAPQGYPNTWWQDHYSANSDPAFVLPWRLDPEKGYPVSEEAKRYQTNDIQLTPANPLPGDTVTIDVRVRNYSLIPTPGPVSVSFYVGDPDINGIPIIGINGTNTINTSGQIPSRFRSDVQMKWIFPAWVSPYERIYAVLDRNNTISEIHEENNKGFKPLGNSGNGGPQTQQLNLKMFVQGFYNDQTNEMTPDTVRVFLRNSAAPYSIIDSSKAILSSTGEASLTFNNALNGTGYYLQPDHRNSVETWSKTAQQFTFNIMTYDFTTSESKAYADNQVQIDNSPVNFGIYNGDENKDGNVDLTDLVNVNNEANSFTSGYVSSDMNGDNITDLTDVVLTNNNSNAFIAKIIP